MDLSRGVKKQCSERVSGSHDDPDPAHGRQGIRGAWKVVSGVAALEEKCRDTTYRHKSLLASSHAIYGCLTLAT
jgi:hypothetical protein